MRKKVGDDERDQRMPDARNPAEAKAGNDPRSAALRANLAKRKQQSRSRRGGKGVSKREETAFDTLLDDEPPKTS